MIAEEDIDTDVIFPARFLLCMEKDGLGRYLFHDRRFAADGRRNSDFVLNAAPFDAARILVCGANFGCGSSREQAVWALAGFGVQCVIAPSFGDIFASNCESNGLLLLTLPQAEIDRLAVRAAAGAPFRIDLQAATLTVPPAGPCAIAITPTVRKALLQGLDEIDLMAVRRQEIAAFETRREVEHPWLFG